jgi:GMP synthase-like glutamine amidotransferase
MRLLMIQHVACEGPGLLLEMLDQKGWEIDIRYMDTEGNCLPGQLKDYQAFIILGGPMGAYEEERYPYLLKVQELVREAAESKIPTIGICLGGQLIARALGAEVGPNRVKEIGWSPVRLLPEGKVSSLFSGLPSAFSVFQWHQDTFSLPEGAVLLVTGETCENQAFVYGDNIWALQFHLEVTPDMIKNWAEVYEDELVQFGGPGAASRLIRNTQASWETMESRSKVFLNNLVDALKV